MNVRCKTLSLFGVLASFILASTLVACGDDSSTAPAEKKKKQPTEIQDPDEERNEDEGGEGNKQDVKDTLPHESSYDSLSIGEMYDSTSGNTYATVQFKSYLWLMGDMENDSYTAKAKCYNDSTENCEKYGKLYMANLAYRACPEGFELPTESDWNDLISYRNSLSGDKKFSLNATMAGFCGYDENGRDFCGNKDKQSLFLTANNSVFVTSDGKSGTFKEAKSDFYYSLRCQNLHRQVRKEPPHLRFQLPAHPRGILRHRRKVKLPLQRILQVGRQL